MGRNHIASVAVAWRRLLGKGPARLEVHFRDVTLEDIMARLSPRDVQERLGIPQLAHRLSSLVLLRGSFYSAKY